MSIDRCSKLVNIRFLIPLIRTIFFPTTEQYYIPMSFDFNLTTQKIRMSISLYVTIKATWRKNHKTLSYYKN